MARTIKEIQGEIATALQSQFQGLSPSAVSTWRLVSHVVAVAIYTFELILDRFRVETEEKTRRITPCTERWYAEMARRFQNGHKLVFDPLTAMYYYPNDVPEAQIAKVVAVRDRGKVLSVKVAKLSSSSEVVPFDPDELQNFTDYIETIHVVGSVYRITSTTPDLLRYAIEIYYDPIYPRTSVEQRVKDALEAFKSTIGFDGTLYSQQLIDALLHVEGVVTVGASSIDRKGATDADFSPVSVWSELHAGYFDYDNESILTLISIRNA